VCRGRCAAGSAMMGSGSGSGSRVVEGLWWSQAGRVAYRERGQTGAWALQAPMPLAEPTSHARPWPLPTLLSPTLSEAALCTLGQVHAHSRCASPGSCPHSSAKPASRCSTSSGQRTRSAPHAAGSSAAGGCGAAAVPAPPAGAAAAAVGAPPCCASVQQHPAATSTSATRSGQELKKDKTTV